MLAAVGARAGGNDAPGSRLRIVIPLDGPKAERVPEPARVCRLIAGAPAHAGAPFRGVGPFVGWALSWGGPFRGVVRRLTASPSARAGAPAGPGSADRQPLRLLEGERRRSGTCPTHCRAEAHERGSWPGRHLHRGVEALQPTGRQHGVLLPCRTPGRCARCRGSLPGVQGCGERRQIGSGCGAMPGHRDRCQRHRHTRAGHQDAGECQHDHGSEAEVTCCLPRRWVPGSVPGSVSGSVPGSGPGPVPGSGPGPVSGGGRRRTLGSGLTWDA